MDKKHENHNIDDYKTNEHEILEDLDSKTEDIIDDTKNDSNLLVQPNGNEYTVNYDLQDSSGNNSDKIIRTVKISPEETDQQHKYTNEKLKTIERSKKEIENYIKDKHYDISTNGKDYTGMLNILGKEGKINLSKLQNIVNILNRFNYKIGFTDDNNIMKALDLNFVENQILGVNFYEKNKEEQKELLNKLKRQKIYLLYGKGLINNIKGKLHKDIDNTLNIITKELKEFITYYKSLLNDSQDINLSKRYSINGEGVLKFEDDIKYKN